MAKHKPVFVLVCLTEGLPNLDFPPIHASSKSKHIRALNSPGPEGLLTKWIEEVTTALMLLNLSTEPPEPHTQRVEKPIFTERHLTSEKKKKTKMTTGSPIFSILKSTWDFRNQSWTW